MSAEKDREAAIAFAEKKYPDWDSESLRHTSLVKGFLAGIQHARQGERGRFLRLLKLCDCADCDYSDEERLALIDEFLEQEAKDEHSKS